MLSHAILFLLYSSIFFCMYFSRYFLLILLFSFCSFKTNLKLHFCLGLFVCPFFAVCELHLHLFLLTIFFSFSLSPSLPFYCLVLHTHTHTQQSFSFPPDAGYPLDSKNERFYMMETHYSDSEPPKDLESLHADPIVDNSGLKLYYTSALRKHDAGVLSIGKLNSNFFP